MTINEVKEKLPDVLVKFHGQYQTGMLSGRQNKFASVTAFKPFLHTAEVSWSAVQRSINNESFIILD